MLNFFKKEARRPKTAAIIVAAGQSTRMNGQSKQFAELLGKPVLAYALEAFEQSPSVDEIYVVCREHDILLVSDIVGHFGITKAVSILPGGATRCESVRCGLDAAGGCDFIAIHDGARPCILPEHIDAAVAAAQQCGAAALGVPVADTLKAVGEDGVITGTLDRQGVWQIQTPQVFAGELIRSAHQNALEKHIEATDDCLLAEAVGARVLVVEGSPDNIKITRPDDLLLASGILLQRGGVVL